MTQKGGDYHDYHDLLSFDNEGTLYDTSKTELVNSYVTHGDEERDSMFEKHVKI